MSDLFQLTPSSRSRCRHCRQEIEEGSLRFGHDWEGLHGDGSASYYWFHPRCAAVHDPKRLLAVLGQIRDPTEMEGYEKLRAQAETNLKRQGSPFPYGERSPSGRAKCMRCDQAIPKDALRVATEREIIIGNSSQLGAGYLHPACARLHLGLPDLAELLIQNSKLLEESEVDELVAASAGEPAAPAAGAAAKVAAPINAPKPTTPAGGELVFADELLEKGDARGEMVSIAHDLAGTTDGARRATLERRARELTKPVLALWKKAIDAPGLKVIGLYAGLPAVEWRPKKKGFSPDAVLGHKWIRAVRVVGTEEALARLIQDPRFGQVEALATDVAFSWQGFASFCATDEIASLRALDITLSLGIRAAIQAFSSTKAIRLEHLTLRRNFSRLDLEPDLRGFERVNGLPALRRLSLPQHLSFASDAVQRVLGSPLGQRLRALDLDAPRDVLEVALPALEELQIRSAWVPTMPIAGTGLGTIGGSIVGLFDPTRYPKLRVIEMDARHRFGATSFDVQPAELRATVASLRAALAEGGVETVGELMRRAAILDSGDSLDGLAAEESARRPPRAKKAAKKTARKSAKKVTPSKAPGKKTPTKPNAKPKTKAKPTAKANPKTKAKARTKAKPAKR